MNELSYDPQCPFCRIIRGEIPASKVLETDLALAFLDINPVNPGHVLLVPKPHHADLSSLAPDHSAHVGGLLPRLVRAIGLVTEAEGFNVVINNGRAAGQTVFHGHWHIIPRFTGDRVHWPWPHGPGYSADERAQIQARLQAALASSQAP